MDFWFVLKSLVVFALLFGYNGICSLLSASFVEEFLKHQKPPRKFADSEWHFYAGMMLLKWGSGCEMIINLPAGQDNLFIFPFYMGYIFCSMVIIYVFYIMQWEARSIIGSLAMTAYAVLIFALALVNTDAGDYLFFTMVTFAAEMFVWTYHMSVMQKTFKVEQKQVVEPEPTLK